MTQKQPVKVYLSNVQREMLVTLAEVENSSKSEILRNAFLLYAASKYYLDDKPQTTLEGG